MDGVQVQRIRAFLGSREAANSQSGMLANIGRVQSRMGCGCFTNATIHPACGLRTCLSAPDTIIHATWLRRVDQQKATEMDRVCIPKKGRAARIITRSKILAAWRAESEPEPIRIQKNSQEESGNGSPSLPHNLFVKSERDGRAAELPFRPLGARLALQKKTSTQS